MTKKEIPNILLTEEQYDEGFERDTSLNIYQRMNLIMREVSYIKKGQNVNGQYNAVQHDDVTAALRPKMIKYGVQALITRMEKSFDILQYKKMNFNTQTEEDKREFFVDLYIEMDYVNIDNPEDRISGVPSIAHGLDFSSNSPGKATSYAVKYNLLKTFNLETGDLEDFQRTTEDNPVELVDEIEKIGSFLFEKDWEKMKLQKVNVATRGKTAELKRVPTPILVKILLNLQEIMRQQEIDSKKSAKDISKDIDKKNQNDVLNHFDIEDDDEGDSENENEKDDNSTK